MKQTIHYYRQQLREGYDLFKFQWKAFCITALVLIGLYVASEAVPPGWATYLIMLPGILIIVATCYTRLNSMGPDLMGPRWQLRRTGFLMIGVGGITLIGMPFLEQPLFPTWRSVLFVWGLSLTWISTPGMVPWDWYWNAMYRAPPDPTRPWSPTQRLVGKITKEYDRRALERKLRTKK